MAIIGHNSVPADISKIGIKMESTQGTEASGDYRGLLVSNFVGKTSKDQSGYSVVAGYKGAFGKNVPGSFVDVSFTILAGASHADQASLTDIVMMLMDADTVTGSSPYVHTFSQANATINKKSWTIYHDDGKSNYAIYNGFVLNSMTMTIDKESGTVPVEVSGMAWQEASTTVKAVDIASSYTVYTPNTAKLTVGSDTINSFSPITLTFECGTEVRNFINNTAYPSAIEGGDLICKVELSGDWNEISGQISDTLKSAFSAGTTMTDTLTVNIGSNSSTDYFTLSLPRWEIEEEDDKDIEANGLLPQSLTVYPVWAGDIATNGWSIVINNSIATDWDSL